MLILRINIKIRRDPNIFSSYLGLVPIGGQIREGISSELLWAVGEKDTNVVLTNPGGSPLK